MFLQEKIDDINERLKQLKEIHNIVIWGAGFHTCKLFEKTGLHSYLVKNIVDKDMEKWGVPYFGFVVQDPLSVDWSNVEAVVISVPNREQEIADILICKFGFQGNIITLYDENEFTPFYLLYDEKVSGKVCYLGDYGTWEESTRECKSYGDDNILNTVGKAVNKLLNGEAAWERDGVLFYEQKYVYPICAAILRCAVRNKNQGVRILDIGGSLGSTYFQNKIYLKDVKNLEYIIVEQDHFVDYGRDHLENNVLKFIKNSEQWEDFGKFDIILLSASLQYIYPYQNLISRIILSQPDYIILDRILVSDRIRICKEIVPEQIYEGSYPVMIFDEDSIMNFFDLDYKLVEKDIASVPEQAFFIDGNAESKFYVFEKIK